MKKQKRLRKLWSVVLTLTLVLLSINFAPQMSVKAEEIDVSGTTGDCSWSYSKSTHILTISGTGKMADYEQNGNVPYWIDASQIYSYAKGIDIKSGVQYIGSYSFDAFGTSSDKTVVIPNTVTSIGEGAFYGSSGYRCNATIIIPSSVVSIGDEAFFRAGHNPSTLYNNSSIELVQNTHYDKATIYVPLNVTTDGHCTCTPSGTTSNSSYQAGTTTTLNLSPNPGYVVSGVTVNGIPATVSGNICTFSTPTYATKIDVTTVIADSIPPTITGGNSQRTSTKTATVKFTSGEKAQYYYSVVEDGASKPTIATSLIGTECMKGENTITLSDLTAGAKDIYIVGKDEAGNLSDYIKMDIDYDITKLHQVTYDGNGNASGTVPIDTNKYLPNDIVKISQQRDIFKNGYILDSWNTKQDGTGTTYNTDSSFTMVTENITLYAQWSEGVRYEAEDATIIGAAKEENKAGASGGSQVGNINEIGRYVEFSNIPAYSKVSVRYASNVSGKISVYLNNDKIKNLKFTSTGGWSGVGKYKDLVFDVNIPKDGKLKIQFDEGDGALNLDYIECYKSLSFKKYEAENANIVGAKKESNVAGASGGSQVGTINAAGRYVEFKDLSAGNKVLIRYATQQTGTISIYKNNVHYQDLSFESTGNWSGNNMYRIASIDIDLKANDSLKVQYDTGDEALNLDYIEICSPLKDMLYDVNFNSNGGTEVLSQKVIANNKAEKPEVPTKSGFIFENWYSDATLTTVFDFNTAITENKTLYAKWIANSRIIINNEDVNKGTVNVTNAESLGENVYNATTGKVITLTAVPQKGYNFDGWYDVSNNKVSSNSTWRFKVTADTTCTAKFISMPTATLTVDINGTGSVSSNDEAWNSNKATTFLLDTTVILIAADSEANPFMYWKDNNGRVVSTKKQYSVNIGNNITLTAVFGTKEEDNICVTFKNGNGEIIQSDYVVKGSDVTFPANPSMYGYTFNGWDKAAEEIRKATGDIVVKALFTKNKDKVNVTVNGGTGSGEYGVKDYVTVTANIAATGQKFSHWKDSNNNIVCYDTTYKFYVSSNIELEAVYGAENNIIEQKASIAITSVTKNTSSKKISFVAERIVPDDCTIISHGIIVTTNSAIAVSETEFIVEGTDVLKGTAKTKGLVGAYVLNKSAYQNETWYARGFITYKDNNGNIVTVYSSTVSETMN